MSLDGYNWHARVGRWGRRWAVQYTINTYVSIRNNNFMVGVIIIGEKVACCRRGQVWPVI